MQTRLFDFGFRRIVSDEYEWYIELEDGRTLLVKCGLNDHCLKAYLPCLAIDASTWDMPQD